MKTTRVLGAGILLSLAVSIVHPSHHGSAHYAATDGAISVELHIDPNDNPLPGQVAKLDFIFEDTTNDFTLAKCDCRLSISRQGKEVFYGPLVAVQFDQPTVYGGGAAYIFPSPGNYRITLSGKPMANGVFRPFNLSWSLTVNQATDSAKESKLSTFLAYFAAILGVFLVAGILLFAVA